MALGRAVARPEEEAARTRVSRWALEAANTAAPLVQGALEVAMALGEWSTKSASIQGRENPFLWADCEFVSKCLYT